MILSLNDIRKSFGTNQVLKGLSFTAQSGRATALIGRNGAGKTTTIRIIMDIFPPDQGEIFLDNHLLHKQDVSIGYLPEEKGFYPKIKIRDQLVYIARLRGLSQTEAKQAIGYWLERLKLSQYEDKKLETLSRGNQQKMQLAIALLTDPRIVILDEPFSGLDPVNTILLKEIVNEQIARDKIVLFSSHQMNLIETTCDSIALLHDGQIKLEGSIQQIKRRYPRQRIALSLASPDRLRPLTGTEVISYMHDLIAENSTRADLIDYCELVRGQCHILLSSEAARDPLLQLLAANNAPVEQFLVVEPTLEDIFIEQTGERRQKETHRAGESR